MPEHVHRHRRGTPLAPRVRELVRQPAKVRPAHGVTARAGRAGAEVHARECAHEGAAHAEVPQGGDGFEGERRGVDVVICIGQVCGAADT